VAGAAGLCCPCARQGATSCARKGEGSGNHRQGGGLGGSVAEAPFAVPSCKLLSTELMSVVVLMAAKQFAQHSLA